MSGASAARDRLSSVLATDRAVMAVAAQQSAVARVHEATRPSRSRKMAQDWGSANNIVGLDAKQLRDSARQRERDHDISRNALNILEQNIVGSGIDVLPAPRLPGGDIDRGLAQALRDLWDEWWDRPEVTGRHDFGKCQQLLCRTWMRDGEALFQTLAGPVPFLDHDTTVPFSIEMIEPDLLPLDFNDPERRISQGIELNAWGRPVAYHIYKSHPGDPNYPRPETKRVLASEINHIALIDRIHQVRGLSVFASVINRLVDIQEYEDSERIAAKVAASLSAQIIKGEASGYGLGGEGIAGQAVVPTEYRALTMRPGLIADDLLPGERIELIDSKRPNPNAALFRDGQLRAVAGGFGTSFSSLSLNYNGSYSAQRQELVEKWGGYQKLGESYIALVMRPTYSAFVAAAYYNGHIRMPKGWTIRNLAAASYVRPVMPWIDPLKEAIAMGEAEDRGWVAPSHNILLRGNDPDDVLRQRQDWADQLDSTDLAPAPLVAPTTARGQLVTALLTEQEPPHV